MQKLPISVDPGGVPYLANSDTSGNLAVPVENYILSGGLYVPVSSSNPLPTNIVGSLANNQTNKSVTASTNILATNYTPSTYQKSVLTVMTNTTGVLNLVIDGVAGAMNSGVALNANQWYSFEVPLMSTSTYNLQLSVSAIMQIKWEAI